MRWGLNSLGMAVVAPIGALTIAWSGAGPLPLPTLPSPTELLAQSLYMRGTKIGGYTDYDDDFVRLANGVLGQTYGPHTPITVDNGDDWMSGDQIEYNGGFWPVSQGGLNDLTYGASVEQGLARLRQRIAAERDADPDEPIVVYGYSQSAVIVARYKATTDEGNIVYVMLSDPARPNGGILSRFRGFTIPFLDIPLSGPAPTTSVGWQEGDPPTTYDIAQQYDGWADFPLYPLNLVSTANAILGIVYLHGNYENIVDPEEDLGADADHTDTKTYRDTKYYTVGTDLLPLLRPLEQIGIPRPLLLALDAPLRVVVEQGYDRTLNPGVDAGARLIRFSNPITDFVNFVNAIPVGLDDGFEAAGMGRPFGTTKAGMYGVGGPQATAPDGPTVEATVEGKQSDPEDQPVKFKQQASEPEASPDENQPDEKQPPLRLQRPRLNTPRVLTVDKTAETVAAPADSAESEPDTTTPDTTKSETDKPDANKPDTSDTSDASDGDASTKPEKHPRHSRVTRHSQRAAAAQSQDKDGDSSARDGGYVGKHRKAGPHTKRQAKAGADDSDKKADSDAA